MIVSVAETSWRKMQWEIPVGHQPQPQLPAGQMVIVTSLFVVRDLFSPLAPAISPAIPQPALLLLAAVYASHNNSKVIRARATGE